MSKGTNTTATIPDWAKPYALEAMRNTGNLQDYFFGGLQDWRNGGTGMAAPGGGDSSVGDDKKTDPLVQIANASGLSATTQPAGGESAAGSGTARRNLTGVPSLPQGGGDGAASGADSAGAPGYYYDPSMLLGYNPQDVPDLSAAQQEWGNLIPQLAQEPADLQTAKDWQTAGLAEAGRVPTLSVGDVLGSKPAAAGGMNASATGMTATTLPASGPSTSTPAAGDWITDPTIRAAKEIFDTTGSEQIKNAMTQAGLGRSTAVGDALAKGWGEQLMPLINQQLNFQNEAINRQQAARSTGTDTFLKTGDAATSRLLSQLGQLQTFGGTQRDVAQQKSDAKEKERMRLQALGEESLFPYSGNISALGSSTRKA